MKMEVDMEIRLDVDEGKVERDTQNTLIWKIMAERVLNRKGVLGVLQNMWNSKEVKAIKKIRANMYAVSFVNR